MGVSEELERLGHLLDEGKLTTEEFERAKAALLDETNPAQATSPAAGWYTHPHGTPGEEAWWNGEAWTGSTRPASTTPTIAVESKSGLPEWVKAIVGIGIAVLVIGYCGGAFTDSPSGVPSVFDPGAPLTSCTSTVIYRVTGTASSASLTISNEQGNTEQEDSVVIPWARRMTFPCGEFVYVSAQNNGESGTIECSISADGQVIESAESSGAFVIADCSGTAP